MKFLHLIALVFIAFQVSFSQNQVEMLDSLFITMHENEQFSGNVLVVSSGEIIYHKSFGYANRETQAILNENTLFNTGAVSQTFTAVAILQLAETGGLNIDEFVTNYLPDFPYKGITLGHLLTHASGLPAKNHLLENWDKRKIATDQDILDLLFSQKPELEFSPGSKSVFNETGYIVLAKVVEVVSKQGFHHYLKQHIFEPAGMTRTAIYNADQVQTESNVAKGYLFSPFTKHYVEAIKSPNFENLYSISGTEGDANVWSTTGDLLRFCMAIADTTLLSEEWVIKMFQKKTDALMPGQTKSYGKSFSYGWIVPEAPYRIAEAKGELPGFNSSITWNLSENRMMIYLSNDFLSFTSYNNMITYSVGTIVTQNTLMIPKKWASVELTNVVLHESDAELRNLMKKMQAEPDVYDIDVPGIEYLIGRLQKLGENEKADLIESLIPVTE